MKRIHHITLCVFLLAFGAMAQAPTPTPATSMPGAVSRVTYMDILPGKNDQMTAFIRMHSKPMLDEQVKQGLIRSYGYFTKPTTAGPGDWDLGLVVTYATYAEAIDYNPERAAKFDAISLGHYGSVEARSKAGDLQNELRTVVSSYLVRAVTFNPMPK